jgi:hypothetical protein
MSLTISPKSRDDLSAITIARYDGKDRAMQGRGSDFLLPTNPYPLSD